ncbi:uncharacterized protein LACBIDRAFT_318644 [Laccaria bicolor S238N-H82]|uniref:Predicted protein n=1 Tax=Laccaria bicolor (strain S238N-H82 / ATCC MYA-4686) TaxID=486041 RepID=B0D6N8_LACBS|nr:uncharacterized protein LACBIDRAFT_318644 [Laccaria bicolor S238N-H82]EDR09256.1 predicted protein [Laccaria bicolor S238N-H82]|eukprot:XP_001879605.1 predicted protein [Laccaria bicolor S238N-H82]
MHEDAEEIPGWVDAVKLCQARRTSTAAKTLFRILQDILDFYIEVSKKMLEETPRDLIVYAYVLFVLFGPHFSFSFIHTFASVIYQSLLKPPFFVYINPNFISSHLSRHHIVSDSEFRTSTGSYPIQSSSHRV